jgi:hypothetical protein
MSGVRVDALDHIALGVRGVSTTVEYLVELSNAITPT